MLHMQSFDTVDSFIHRLLLLFHLHLDTAGLGALLLNLVLEEQVFNLTDRSLTMAQETLKYNQCFGSVIFFTDPDLDPTKTKSGSGSGSWPNLDKKFNVSKFLSFLERKILLISFV